MKKKIILSILAVIIIITAIFGINQNNSDNNDNTLKVGIIAPLSGQYGFLGESARDAIILNLENEEGIKIFAEDDEFDSKKAISAYQKLTSIDDIDVLINLASPSISALQSSIDADQLITFHLTESDYKSDDTVFQAMPFSYPIFSAIGKEAGNRYERIALVYGNIDIFVTNSKYFKEGLSSEKIVHEVQLSSNSDLRTEVSKILASNPDAMTMIVDKETGIKLIKTFKEQIGDRDVDIICDANMELSINDYTEVLGTEVFEGCISANLPTNTTDEFKEEFNSRFGYYPIALSDYAYDAAEIIKQLKSEPESEWKDDIQNTEFNGVSGVIKFDELI